MANGVGLVELRNKIDAVYLKMMAESGGKTVHNDDILKRIESELQGDLSQCRGPLIGLSLVKLVNDVSRRRGRPSVQTAGLDLFGEVSGIPHSVSVGRGMKIRTADMSLGAAKVWLKKHPPKPAKDPFEKLRSLVSELEGEGASECDSLSIILERKMGPGQKAGALTNESANAATRRSAIAGAIAPSIT
jgi:hypothetical protein